MAKSSFLLTISQISIVQLEQPVSSQTLPLPLCKLKWRSNQLWVKAIPADSLSGDALDNTLPAVKNEHWLQQCLRHSSITRVCLDQNLGATAICQWADACEVAGKPAYVRLPFKERALLKSTSSALWHQVLHQGIAALLLLVLAPVLLGIFLWRYLESPKAVVTRPWCVGRQERLFRLIRFQTEAVNRCNEPAGRTLLQRFLVYSRIVHWPELINVFRGKKMLGGSTLLWLGNESGTVVYNQSRVRSPVPEPVLTERLNSSSPEV